ncbi:MAG: hypothetical protein WAM60_15965 [Candidatus Promineifilaceae bacterium]
MEEEQEVVVEEDEEAVELEVVTPIIVDLGKTKRKSVKKLKRGKGPLVDEITDVLDEVAEALEGELDDKVLVPLVIIYEKKGKKKRKITLPF